MRFLKLLAVNGEAHGRLDPQQTESGINQPLPAEYASRVPQIEDNALSISTIFALPGG